MVLGGMAEGVIAIDSRRRLLFANKSADHLFGLGPQAVGRLVPELIRSPQIQEAVDATLGGPDSYRGEILLPGREVLPRSLPRVLAVHGSLLPGSSPSGAVLVFHDVTELRRLERMRQDFVANVSHELKTPLASIKAYTETLLDWALHDEEVNVRFLNRIEEQADRLNQLILDLLSLARLESGHEVFHHGPLAVSAVVESCIETHRGPGGVEGAGSQPRPRADRRVDPDRRRRGGGPPDPGQPDRQRDQIYARKAAGSASAAASPTTPSASTSPTPGSASPATTSRASSSGSTGSTRPGAARWAGPGWASRSSST